MVTCAPCVCTYTQAARLVLTAVVVTHAKMDTFLMIKAVPRVRTVTLAARLVLTAVVVTHVSLDSGDQRVTTRVMKGVKAVYVT